MRLVRALFIALLFGTVAGAAPAAASPFYDRPSLEVDAGLFYDDLSPYGDWIDSDDYGWAWSPRVSSGWQPYTLGQWVWTDQFGWLWVSSEPYGWAVFHYGRWHLDPFYGWVWVPGYEWGPAWVSFRSGGGYIGWAPLPPRAAWHVGIGFNFGPRGFDSLIAPDHYCFVQERSFLDYSLPRYAVPRSHNVTIINVTQNITNYTVVQNRIVNRSLSVDHVQRAVGRAIPRLRAVDLTSVQSARQARVRGDEVAVFRPIVRQATTRTPPRGSAAARREAVTQPRDIRERVERTRSDESEQRRAAERPELEARRELEKQREATARREAEAQRALQQRRDESARREVEARRELEKRREEDQRAAARQREDQARREVEARRELEQRREATARREAEAQRALQQRRDESARREVEARRELEQRREATARREAEAQRALQQRRDESAGREVEARRVIEQRQAPQRTEAASRIAHEPRREQRASEATRDRDRRSAPSPERQKEKAKPRQ